MGSALPLIFKTIPAGYTQQEHFSLLFDFEHEKYVFEEAGQYEIRILPRIYAGQDVLSSKILNVTSDPLLLTVNAVPEKFLPALALWRGKEQARIMVQVEGYDQAVELPQGLQKLKELIRLYPDAPYAATAEHRLKKIGDPELNALFPEDRRLDAKIEVDFPKLTPYQDVFESFTKQSGVTLSFTPELKDGRIVTLKQTSLLREAMKNLTGHSSKWEKKGDGYLLRKKTPEEQADDE